MNRNELKPGLLVKLRNGQICEIQMNFNGDFYVEEPESKKNISFVDEYAFKTIKHNNNTLYDIMEIYQLSTVQINKNGTPTINTKIIWQRDETPLPFALEFESYDEVSNSPNISNFRDIQAAKIQGQNHILINETKYRDKNNIASLLAMTKYHFQEMNKTFRNELLILGFTDEEINKIDFSEDANTIADLYFQLYEKRLNLKLTTYKK